MHAIQCRKLPCLEINAKFLKVNAKLPTDNIYCRMPFKNTKFEFVGSGKCQMATLITLHHPAVSHGA